MSDATRTTEANEQPICESRMKRIPKCWIIIILMATETALLAMSCHSSAQLVKSARDFILGLLATFVIGDSVTFIRNETKKLIPTPPPNEETKEKWAELTKDSPDMFQHKDSVRPTDISEVLGLVERLIFFIVFWMKMGELAIAWLAFKVASKWEVWNNISSLPKELEAATDLEYLIARRKLGAQTLEPISNSL